MLPTPGVKSIKRDDLVKSDFFLRNVEVIHLQDSNLRVTLTFERDFGTMHNTTLARCMSLDAPHLCRFGQEYQKCALMAPQNCFEMT
jgi:hypothetical protein